MYKERAILEKITENLFKDRTIVIYGARRTGKTTLVKHILDTYKNSKSTLYMSCENSKDREAVETTITDSLERAFGDYNLVVIDEAQMASNIGMTLKIMHDFMPQVQIIATGSSSFDLKNKIGEPLVGRSRTYKLYPFSLKELDMDFLRLDASIEHFLRFGLYPSVVELTEKQAIEELMEIKDGYLYKDILAIGGVKNSRILLDLLGALALQVGNEVSYREISNRLNISVATVQNYIDLLEKCFVIFVLPAFSRNLRKEIGIKSRKIYFYDVGIRNAIINAFAPMNMRADVGALWENFCIVELMKKAQNNRHFANNYFWRTYDQQEIDLIEDYDGVLHAYEFKYNPSQKAKLPKIFAETYQTEFCAINRKNYYQYLL